MDSGDRTIFFTIAAVLCGVFCILGGVVGCSIHKQGRTLIREKIVKGQDDRTISSEMEVTTYPMED